MGNKIRTKTQKPRVLRFGTWNIRFMYKLRALCITNSIKEYNVDLIYLQKVRWPKAGYLKSNNMTNFYNGSDNGRHEYGMGFSCGQEP